MRRQILIVEDEPELRANLSDVLKENGFTVRTANDGVEAIEAAEIDAAGGGIPLHFSSG